MQDATAQTLAATATASAASGVAATSLWQVIGIGPAVLFMALTGTALGLLFSPVGGSRARLFALAVIYTVVSAALAVLLAEIPGLDFLKRIAPVLALLLAFFAQSAIPALRDAINARLQRTVGGRGDADDLGQWRIDDGFHPPPRRNDHTDDDNDNFPGTSKGDGP